MMEQNTADFVDCFQLNLMNLKVEEAMCKKKKNVDKWTGVLKAKKKWLFKKVASKLLE